MVAPRKPDYAGGNQMQMFPPASSWVRPTELPDLRHVKEFGIDTETKDEGLSGGRGPGWVYKAGRVVGFSLAWGQEGQEQTGYFPLSHPETDNFDKDAVSRWLTDHRHVRWIMHNAPYDLGWMRADLGLECPVNIDDTTAMAVILDEHHFSYKLDDVAKRCGLSGKDEKLLREAAACYGFNPKTDMHRMPARYVGDYAGADALQTLQAARFMRPLLLEEESTDAYMLEMDLIPMIQEMRWRGIRVDVDKAEQSKIELLKRRDAAFAEIKESLGERVGMEEIGKASWLQRVFDQEAIQYPRTAPTSRYPDGQPSFTSGVAGWMDKHPHWLPKLITKADKAHNAATKFLQGFIIDYSHKGRIHASINQFMSDDDQKGKTGTRTHRFSYSDPALQQMPSRDPEVKEMIRGCFLPEEGQLWGRIDYEQQEYRLIVHFAKQLGLEKAAEAAQTYIDNPATDFHALVAGLTLLPRGDAKQVNFAKAYGSGLEKFATLTNMSLEDAERTMTQYDTEMPFVKDLNDKCKNLAGRRGYVRLVDGARMHFPFWEGPWMSYADRNAHIRAGHNLSPCRLEEAQNRQNDEEHPWHGKLLKRADTRKAMSALVQGSAARQTKLAMRACWKAGLVPMIQIHDELAFSCDNPEQGYAAAKLMREVLTLEIPMGADVDFGTNWATAKYKWNEAFEQLHPTKKTTRKRKAA